MEFTQSNPTNQTNPTQTIQPEEIEHPEDYTTYEIYTNRRLTCTPVETKQIPHTKEEHDQIAKGIKVTAKHYYVIPIKYNYAKNETDKNNKEFYFEGCEVFSPTGIMTKPGPSGREESSIMIRYNISNPEESKMIAAQDEVHAGCAHIVQQYRHAVKIPSFSAEHAVMCGFKNPTYRPVDSTTGEIMQGASPTCFMKLFKRPNGSTLFTDPNGTPIDWKLLRNVELTFIPLIHFKRIYVGSKPSLQSEVKSGIVTKVQAQNSTSLQTYTLQKLQAARPDLVNSVTAQLAKLTTDRQDLLLKESEAHKESETSSTESSGPTFDGLVPTNTSPKTSPLPTITPLPTSMQDFTSGAPVSADDVPVIPTINLS